MPTRALRRAAVLVDIVGSRETPNRRALHRAYVTALDEANAAVAADQPLRVTVGDEAQGVYPTLGGAIDAAWRVRCALLPTVDVRVGIGVGDVAVLDETTGIQDGSAWWAARRAIERVEEEATHAGCRSLRTAIEAAEDGDDDVTAADAAVRCRDLVVGCLPDVTRSIVGGLVRGRQRKDIAADLGISPSAVSAHAGRYDLDALLVTSANLAGLP